MASTEMYVDIESIIEKHEELHAFIVNASEVNFDEGDIVKCSYMKNKFYEVIKTIPEDSDTLAGKVALYDFDKKINTAIGKKFLKKVEVDKNAMKILFKS